MDKVICEIIEFSQTDVVATSPACPLDGGGTTCSVGDD